jgi:hypothetical protein
MLYTHWRNEESDLYAEFDTYEENNNTTRDQLIEQTHLYEPFIDAVETAQSALAADAAEAEDQWNILAPGAQ